MDLVETLRRKIAALEEGDYLAGLKAVLLHIVNRSGFPGGSYT
jgi:hypothetical protein